MGAYNNDYCQPQYGTLSLRVFGKYYFGNKIWLKIIETRIIGR